DVPEVALGLAQVVRLGVGLAGEDFVGELGVGAVRERVVDTRALRGPQPERAARPAGGALELGSEQAGPLGGDHDGAVAGLGQPAGDPRWGEGLAGAGRADDERVSPAGPAGGNADGSPALVAPDGEAAPVDPPSAANVAAVTAALAVRVE